MENQQHNENIQGRHAVAARAPAGELPGGRRGQRRQRKDRLERAVGLLQTHQDRLVAAMRDDFGHRSEHQSLFTDIAGSIGPLRHAQANLEKWMKPEKRKVGPFPLNLLGAKARVEYQPLGVVGVISPWNFPVNLTFTPLAGILGAGNRCMIKPS